MITSSTNFWTKIGNRPTPPFVEVVHVLPNGHLVDAHDPNGNYLCFRVRWESDRDYLVHPDQSIQDLVFSRLSISLEEREVILKLVREFCQQASTQK